MTSKRLRAHVQGVIAVLVALITSAVVLKATGLDEAYSVVKDLSPLMIAILGAYLASKFQERAAFLSSLRALWSSMIRARNQLVSYTFDPAPTDESYREVFMCLSQVIDEMRGVYKNVGESDAELGLYPYEPLHDMRKVLRDLGPGPSSEAEREEARRKLGGAWDSLRYRFLPELGRADAPEPITDWWSVDPRRPSRSLEERGSAPA
jgi:hypothetical protein